MGLIRPCKAFKDLITPSQRTLGPDPRCPGQLDSLELLGFLKALKGPIRPYEILKGLIRPYKTSRTL